MRDNKSDFEALLAAYIRIEELLNPYVDIRATIQTWQSELTPSQQRMGLKATFADIAEQITYMRPEEIRKINIVLAAEGLMTLSELRVLHGRRVKRLLKTQKIRNETDAIILNDAIQTGLLSLEEAQIAHELIRQFSQG